MQNGLRQEDLLERNRDFKRRNASSLCQKRGINSAYSEEIGSDRKEKVMRKIKVYFMSGSEMEIEVKLDAKVYVNNYNELVINDKVSCWNVDYIHG